MKAINCFHSSIWFDCTTICVIWQSPNIWVIFISNITIFTVIWITMEGMNTARLYGLLPSKDWSLYNTTFCRPLLALALLGMLTILVALRLQRLIRLSFAKKLVIWRCFISDSVPVATKILPKHVTKELLVNTLEFLFHSFANNSFY